MNEELDITWGPATIYIFQGEIIADNLPGSEARTHIVELRASLAKRNKLSFTDHYGNQYSVVAIGPFPEKAISPSLRSLSNLIYVTVQLVGIMVNPL